MAALIPGLGDLPQDNSGNSGFTPNQRPNAPQDTAQVPQLHPVSQQLDTFIRPPQAMSQDANLQRIADSLKAFQPDLQNYSQSSQMLEKVQADNAMSAIPAGSTPEQVGEIAKSNPALQSQLGQNMVMRYQGDTIGNQLATQIETDYNDPAKFDKFHGNLNDFMSTYTQGVAKQYGQNQFLMDGVNKRLDPLFKQLQGQQASYVTQQAGEIRQGDMGQHIQSLFEQVLGDKTVAPADKAGAFYKAFYQTADTEKGVFGTDFGAQQKALADALRVAGTKVPMGIGGPGGYSERSDLINGIANYDRAQLGRAGVTGPLTSNPTIGPDVASVAMHADEQANNRDAMLATNGTAKLMEQAQSHDPNFQSNLKQFISDYPRAARYGAIQHLQAVYDAGGTQANLKLQVQQVNRDADDTEATHAATTRSLLLNGQGDQVQPLTTNRWEMKDGIPQPVNKTIEPEAQKLAQAKNLQTSIDQDPRLANDPQGKFEQESKLWVQNSIENPQWKQQLTGGYNGVSTMTEGGKPSQAQLDSYGLYKQLQAKSPAYTASLMGDGKASEFYRTAQNLEETGADTASALSQAARYQALPADQKPKEMVKSASLPDDNSINQAIQKSMSGGWFGSGSLAGQFGSNEIANRIKTDATVLSHLGVDPQTAITTAASKITQQYTSINGAVVNIGNKQVPPYFGTAAQRVIDDYWTAHGTEQEAEGHAKSDLVIQPLNGTPNWLMQYKSGYQPPGNSSFNLDDLARANQRNQSEKMDKVFSTPAAVDDNPMSAGKGIRAIGKGIADSSQSVSIPAAIATKAANSPHSASVPDAIGKALHGFGNSLFKPLVPLDNQ